MKIKLVTGKTTFEACKNTISKIDTADFDKQNLVVVPDSFSMQAESLIFDVLNIKSTLNIEVVGISRLASKILRQNNISYDRMSGLEEVFNVFKVVKNNEKNFKYFKKCDVDFCVKILQIIKQFKACKIAPEHIRSVGDDYLDNKMHDLKLIYQDFQIALGDKLDLSKLLEFFIEKSKKQLNLSKINLFFANFDSFSAEINSFICKLATQVNQVFIGCAKPISQAANSFIYEDDIMRKTIAFAKKYSVNVEVEQPASRLNQRQEKLVKNLFALKVEEQEKDDFFVNLVSKNKTDEIEFVAKIIKKQIRSGKRFKDFAVAVPNSNYYEQVKSIFDKFDISFYCDDACNLLQTVLGRFLFKSFEFAKLPMGKEAFQYFLVSPLTRPENAEEKLMQINYLNIESENDFLRLCPEAREYFSLLNRLKSVKNTEGYIQVLVEILRLVHQNLNNLLLDLNKCGLYKKESENLQSQELVLKTLDKIADLGKNDEFSLNDFESLLKLAFVSVKVETIPTYLDAVFVGDATDSYFEDVDTLFVLGATSNLPKARADNGIIDDDDIKRLKINFALEPEIKVINRRNRLKLFELLQHAKNKLIVSTPVVEDGKQAQKAGFVSDLCKMFGKNIYFTDSAEELNLANLDSAQKLENLLFYVAQKNNLLDAYMTLKSKGKIPPKDISTFKKLLKSNLPKENKIEISKRVVEKLKSKVFSASQLETFFGCPFRHFLNYKLKIDETQNIEPTKRLFGSFQHEMLKSFVETFSDLGAVEKEEIELFLDKNLLEVAKHIYHEEILNREHFVKYLRNESEIILKNVVKEQKNSKFKPFLLEEKVFLSFDEKYDMLGYVDRVDKSGDYFRVLDYKTGKTDNVKKDLYYGKKLQLLLYAYAIKQKTKLKCAGVYYFDCKTKYTKTNEPVVMLKGLTKKDNEVVDMMDDRLWQEDFKSDLLGMQRKKSAKDDEFAFKYGNTESDFEALFDYAKVVSKNALDEINSGYVEAKPNKGACEFCPYHSVCRHREVQGYRILQTIKDENLKGLKDEN